MLYGPPGTGKTASLLGIIKRELREHGIGPKELAFMSFTNKAVDEGRQRIIDAGLAVEDDLTWFRTCHYTALRLSRRARMTILDPAAFRAFASAYGYDLTPLGGSDDAEPHARPRRTPDDDLAATVDWCRARGLSLEDGLRDCPRLVDPEEVRLFVRRYAAFKAESKAIDFADILENALEDRLEHPARVIVVDEAQDLSPIQTRLIEQWSRKADRVYVAGDDDQSVMRFAGGGPDWMLSLERRQDLDLSVTKLDTSHRLPAEILAFASNIIGEVDHRVSKPFRSLRQGGAVDVVPTFGAAWEASEGAESVLVLARDSCFLRRPCRLLRERGLLYEGVGAAPKCVHQQADLRRAIEVGQALLRGEKLTRRALQAWVARVDDGSGVVQTAGVRWGGRFHLYGRDELVDLGFRGALELLEAAGPARCLLGIDEQRRVLLQTALELNPDLRQVAPRITVSTIHSAKGGEAHTVVIVPNLTRRSWKALIGSDTADEEDEFRLAYVAASRARERVILVQPRTRRAFPYSRYL